jgi:hypothetical protein
MPGQEHDGPRAMQGGVTRVDRLGYAVEVPPLLVGEPLARMSLSSAMTTTGASRPGRTSVLASVASLRFRVADWRVGGRPAQSTNLRSPNKMIMW